MIEILPHNPEWISTYNQIKEFVWPKVKDFAISIEHVGSTSIPDLPAKPVVDMVIVVDGSKNSQHAVIALTEMGYEHRGDLGIPGREAFRKPAHILMKHHLYVVLKDSLSLKNHLTFKKYLLENSEARLQYGNLKLNLAKKYQNNIDLYCEGKTFFITQIFREIGMSDSEIQEIDSANQNKDSQIVLVLPEHSRGIERLARSLPQWFTETGIQNLCLDLPYQKGFVFLHPTSEVLGFLTYFVNQGIAQIGWMGVAPEFQRRRIGKKMLEHLEADLKSHNIQELLVSTLGDSVDYEPYEKTRAFYRKYGFGDFKKILHPENPEFEEELILKKIPGQT